MKFSDYCEEKNSEYLKKCPDCKEKLHSEYNDWKNIYEIIQVNKINIYVSFYLIKSFGKMKKFQIMILKYFYLAIQILMILKKF